MQFHASFSNSICDKRRERKSVSTCVCHGDSTIFFLGCGRGGGGGRRGGVALSLVAVLAAAVGSDIVDRGGGGGGGGAGQVRDLGGGGGGRGVNAVAAAADPVSGVPVVVLPDVQRDLRKLLIID